MGLIGLNNQVLLPVMQSTKQLLSDIEIFKDGLNNVVIFPKQACQKNLST